MLFHCQTSIFYVWCIMYYFAVSTLSLARQHLQHFWVPTCPTMIFNTPKGNGSVLQYVAYSMGRCWEWKHQKNHCTFFWCRKEEEWINAVACNAQFRLQKAKEPVVIHIPLRTHPQRYKLQMLYTGIPPWAMCITVTVQSQFWVCSALTVAKLLSKTMHYWGSSIKH